MSPIYASGACGTISSAIRGTSGLMVLGSGTLTLAGDSSKSLNGSVSVHSGTLIAANKHGSATGLGSVTVGSLATVELTGTITGPIVVRQAGTLYLNGGVAQGDVTVTATSAFHSAAPGGILEGSGQISGKATVAGVIRAGPKIGTLEVQGDIDFAGTNIYWTLGKLADNSTSQAGVAWNLLHFHASGISVGIKSDPVWVYLDFSRVQGPDSGNSFWAAGHTWTLWKFANNSWSAFPEPGNFYFKSGHFTFGSTETTTYLTWTPTSQQNESERRLTRARISEMPCEKA